MNENKIIIWIDDEINHYFLRPYVDELEEKHFTIVKVMKIEEVSSVLENIDENLLSAIIVDISMPSGNFNLKNTIGGLRTGIIILKKIIKDQRYRKVPTIVFTNVDDEEVEMFCDDNNIPYLKKEDYFSDEFEKELNNLIKKKHDNK